MGPPNRTNLFTFAKQGLTPRPALYFDNYLAICFPSNSEKYTQMICQITFWIENDPPNPLRSADTLFWRFGAKLPIYKAGPFAQCDSVFNGQNRTRQYFCIHAQISARFRRFCKDLQVSPIPCNTGLFGEMYGGPMDAIFYL